MLDHDAGFMWHLVSGANYRINGVIRWVHVKFTYADFFFVEAMLKLKDEDFCIVMLLQP